MSYLNHAFADIIAKRTYTSTTRLHRTPRNFDVKTKEFQVSLEDTILIFAFLSHLVEEREQ